MYAAACVGQAPPARTRGFSPAKPLSRCTSRGPHTDARSYSQGAAPRPELRIVKRDGQEIACDSLNIKEYATLVRPPSLCSAVPCAVCQCASRRRGLHLV